MTTEKDILVIGGGVIGLSVARELHRHGAGTIGVIEAGTCGGSASWAAAGMLGPQAEADEAGLFFQFCSASRDQYPGFAAELFEETGVDIELDRAGTLSLAFTDAEIRMLRTRYEWQTAAGFEVEHLTADEVRSAEPFISPDVVEALFFPGDWQVDNRKLCVALRRYCDINAIEIVENSPVIRLLTDDKRVSGVETNKNKYSAGQVVVAAGAWTSQLLLGNGAIPVSVEPVRGQMIAMHTAKRLFEHVIYGSSGYIVPRRDGRILAGSTIEKVGFDSETTDIAASTLFTMACSIAPSLVNLEISDRWAGLRPRSTDGLPVIGRIEGIDGLYLATAHYRNGILLAPATARLAAAALLGGEGSEYPDTFSPDRFRLRAVQALH